MSIIKQILEKRGMLLCSGCGMQMRPQQGTCPDCGVSYGFGMGAKDAPEMSEAKTEEEPTSDFKLDKIGRKIKASKIIFNKGEDDSTKKVQENMKPTFKDIITALAQMRSEALQPEIDEATAPWETDAEAAKREKEASNFKKPNNPARSGMETAKALAQRGLKKASANEELKGKQHKIDKNKNGKVDAHDFKLLRKEEEVAEASFYGNDKMAKAAQDSGDSTATVRMSDKKGDYTATMVRKQGEKDHKEISRVYDKKDVKEDVDESTVPENMKGKQKPYVSSDGKGGYEVLGNQGQVKATFSQKEHGKDARSMARAHVQKHYDTYLKEEDMNEEMHPDADKVLKHIKPEHHEKYKPDLTKKHYTGNYADRSAVLKAAERAGHMKESVFDWKNNPRETKDKTKTSTYHDVKKISTGTVYTKQFDKDGTSKGTGDDAAKKAEGAVKRGRGRPKKDKFAESVEMLMSLSEDQFDSMMEEGFDAFFEAYEQLDELSKTTLGDYAKKASRESTINRKIAADFEHMSDRSRTPGMKQAAGVNAQHYKVKSWKRRDGADKAIDKLTK